MKSTTQKTWAEENEEFLKSRREDEAELLGTPFDLPPFWKPVKPGEEIVGKLVSVKPTKFEGGLGLRIRQIPSGEMIAVPVTAQLEDIDWQSLGGKFVRFTYAGEVPLKNGQRMKQFRVALIRQDEVTPF